MKTVIPGYDIVKKLGEGPQSVVYKAFHKKNPDRPLALKILKAASVSEHQKSHFRQKIEHLKVLNDPLLITPLSFEIKGEFSFITQDYFDGVTLNEWNRTQTEISLNNFFIISCRLAQALDKVHEAGIIHGGVKGGQNA